MLTKQIHQQLRLAIAVAVTNISPAWAGIFPRLSQALPNCGAASAPSWMKGISCRAALHTSRDQNGGLLPCRQSERNRPWRRNRRGRSSSGDALPGRIIPRLSPLAPGTPWSRTGKGPGSGHGSFLKSVSLPGQGATSGCPGSLASGISCPDIPRAASAMGFGNTWPAGLRCEGCRH
jgi:hypothetical protein